MIVDEFGKVKCWVDASEPGTGNWMKYVRSAPNLENQNMVPVQVDGKVFYKAIHSIAPGEELLVLKDAAFPDQEGNPIQLIEEKQYECDECHNSFRSKVALRRHQKYACNNANAIFSTLNQEFKAANAVMESKASSDDGQSKMMPEDSDEGHSGSEMSKGEEFNCSNCSRSFHWKSDLIKHQAMHCGDRMYPCENCGKCFSDPSNLHRHIRSQHEGARSHPCPECGKTFATSSGLKQHTHIHSSIKPFTCEVCLKSYTQFSNLCRHKRMHANCRTQLKCATCGQTFSTVTSLNKHRRFCHNAQVFNSQLSTSISPSSHSAPSAGVLLRGNAPLLGMPPSSSLYQAGLAHMWNANLHLSQQALMQNNLLSGSGTSNSVIRGPYPFGYPPLSAHPSLLASSLNASALASATENANKAGKGMSTEEWLQHYTANSEKGGDSKESPRSIKVERDDSEAVSEASGSTPSGSELDCSSYSDVESETEMEVTKPKRVSDYIKKEKPDDEISGKISPSLQGLPLMKTGSSEPIKAIASIADRYFSSNPGGYGLLSIDTMAKLNRSHSPPSLKRIESPVKKSDNPFDISKRLLRPFGSQMRRGDDQPLDLSLPRPKKSSDHDHKDDDMPKRPSFFGIPTALLGKSGDVPASVAFSYPGALPHTMDPIYRVHNRNGPPADKYQRMDNGEKVPAVQVPLPHFPPLPKMDFYAANKNLMKFRGLPSHQAYALNSTMMYSGSSPSEKMVIRSKDRYTCKYCGKLFPRSANLTRHLRTHTGEQPYSCKYCDRSFSISSNLQRHVRNIHNKEKPFKCPLCDRCFGQQTNLDRHLKKHESEDFSGDSQTPEKVSPDDRPHPLRKNEEWGDELSEKDEAYFTEIKNFIGVAEMKARRDLQLQREKEEKLSEQMSVDRVKNSIGNHDNDADNEADAEEKDCDERVVTEVAGEGMKLKLKLPLALRKESTTMEMEMERPSGAPKVAMEMDSYQEDDESLPRTPDSEQDMRSEDAMSVSEYQEEDDKDDDASSTARPDSLEGDDETAAVDRSRLNGHHPKLQAYSIMMALSEDERKKAVLSKGQPLMVATQHTATVV